MNLYDFLFSFHLFVIDFQIFEHEALVIRPDQSLTFSSADYIKYKILKYASQHHSDIIIIDGINIQYIDSTAAKVSDCLHKSLPFD